jgi:hypothetical protein
MALAAIGPAARAAEAALRTAEAGDGLPALRAAHALRQLCQDPAPLVAVAAGLLDSGHRLTDWDLNLVAEAGPDAASLVPRLRTYLTGRAAETYPDRELQVAAARVVWRAVGDIDAVAPTLDAVLLAGERPAARASELLAELPPELLGPFVPVLRGLAERTEPFHGAARVPAARALWRAGAETAGLVPLLLEEIAGPWGSIDGADLLAEMGDLGAVPGLRALAEQDARVVTSGSWDSLVWEDDTLRRRLLDAITMLQIMGRGTGNRG